MSGPVDRLAAALADRYRLEREVGHGGMATVYLAQDLRHDRKVALKVLRPELAAVIGAERFLAEIKTTANLQHPHILALFDSGQVDGTVFYVMPYVEGESLRDRLTREKQLPVEDAVRTAREVADALQYAHEHGVIHRDIKPENILLHGGHALVADFGIALAAATTAGTRMTETGMSLGTPTYMSPEQAMGERNLDARTDIYALGCVAYEMLTGEPPFSGPTAQAIVAKVMTASPEPVTTLRKTVPAHVARAVHRAIEKLPADRFPTAAAFSVALVTEGGAATWQGQAAPRPSRVAGVWPLGLVTVLATVAAFALGRRTGHAGAGPAVFDAALPDSAPMSFAATTGSNSYGISLRNLSVAPSGDFAVYAARTRDTTQLWYRNLHDATVRPIPGTLGATAPRISPDEKRVAYYAGGRVMVSAIAGGEARRLLDVQTGAILTWIANDTLLAIHDDGWTAAWLDPNAGQIRTKGIVRCAAGSWLPAERRVLCSANSLLYLVDLETGARTDVRIRGAGGAAGALLRGSAGTVVDGRFLVFIAPDGDLRATPYDPKTALVGRPVTLLRAVRRESIGEAQYTLTDDGTLVFAPGMDGTVGRIVRLRPGGTPEPLPLPEAAYQRFDLSPDERWLAAAVTTADAQELRVYDLRDGQQLILHRGELVRHPIWSPAGGALVFSVRDSTRWTVLTGTPNSGTRPDTLYTSVDPRVYLDPVDFRVPGELILQNWDSSSVSRMDPGSSGHPVTRLLDSDARFATVSPDGHHLMYQTVEGSRIIVTSYPRPARRWQLASAGAEPLWLSATEVLYRSGVTWYLVRIDPATGEPHGAGTVWGHDPRFSDTSGWSNRPSRDGGIIYVEGPAQTSTGYIRVIPGWVAQMKAAVDSVNR